MELGDITLFTGLLLVLPVVFLIHEIGHAFFVILFGGEVVKITLGKGNRLFRFGVFEVNLAYFWGGACYWRNVQQLHRVKRLLILMGGIIFNLLTGLVVLYATGLDLWEDSMRSDFVWYSLAVALFSFLPFSESGKNTDGKQIYQLIRFGHSSFDASFDPDKNHDEENR